MRYKDIISLPTGEVDNNPQNSLKAHDIDKCDAIILNKISRIEEIQELIMERQKLYASLME